MMPSPEMMRIVGHWQVVGALPTKNSRHRIIRLGNRSGLRNSGRFLDFARRLQAEVKKTGHQRIESGSVGLVVDTFWPKLRHLEGATVPHGDFDATLSAVSDALEIADVIDDDARIVWGYARKFHSSTHWASIRLIHVS